MAVEQIGPVVGYQNVSCCNTMRFFREHTLETGIKRRVDVGCGTSFQWFGIELPPPFAITQRLVSLAWRESVQGQAVRESSGFRLTQFTKLNVPVQEIA